MFMTRNEAYLLAFGFSICCDGISFKLKKGSIYNEQFNMLYDDVYILQDPEEGMKFYQKFKKTFNKFMKYRSNEFINNCYIVKLAEEYIYD